MKAHVGIKLNERADQLATLGREEAMDKRNKPISAPALPDPLITSLQMITRQILLIPTDELEQHVDNSQTSLRAFQSFAPVLDPANYFQQCESDNLSFAELQLEIAQHILAIRKLIDQMPEEGQLQVLLKALHEELN